MSDANTKRAGHLERLLTVGLVVSALGVSASVVHREFGPVGGNLGELQDRPPVFVESWQNIERSGVLVGESSARVRITEFADLECPYCKLFQSRLDSVRARFGRDVSVTFVHLPLPNHRFARPAARAAECAGLVGKFGQFVDAIYRNQDTLGLKSWAAIALEAGIADTLSFGSCANSKAQVSRVEAGLRIAEQHKIGATPTVLINGWRFANPPSTDEMISAAERLLQGKPLADTVGERRR